MDCVVIKMGHQIWILEVGAKLIEHIRTIIFYDLETLLTLPF